MLMTVQIDGKYVERKVNHMGTIIGALGFYSIPDLDHDEECLWCVGSEIPIIVKKPVEGLDLYLESRTWRYDDQ